MRGGQRQPLDRPLMEGLGNTACSLECLACLNHVHGWTIWGGYGTGSQTPLSRSTDRSQAALGDGSVWILVTRIIEQQPQPEFRTSLVPKPLPSCDAFASDWSIPRTPGSVSSSHHPSPLPRATYDWAYPIGSPFSIAMYGVTDSCAKRLASTVPAYVSKSGFFSAPPLDDIQTI